ncbi:MAG: hypothetical protein Q4B68_09215 [Bacteroidales bacterium]|nr:hypothetical protein [Bacteroidales bacterium]
MASTLLLALSACGTGIETTDKVTDRDVKKVEDYYAAASVQSSLHIEFDSVASWKPGKRFFVTSDRIALVFEHAPEQLHLAGKHLTYKGYETGSLLDNRAVVTLRFADAEREYRFCTNKELHELSANYQVPFLVDEDMVSRVAKQIVGKTLYTRTRLWYSVATQQLVDGRQYVPVKVDSVLPGDDALPLKVVFTTVDTHEQAMLRLSCGKSIRSRDFDAMFSLKNPQKEFPEITPENWLRITRGKVALGMNKVECRLAKGSPKQIVRNPKHDGMGEYWYYDGGEFLHFEDGILKQYR